MDLIELAIHNERRVASLEARNKALRDMLRRVEWEGGKDCRVCPLCSRDARYGHSESCELAALLEETD